MPIEVIIHDTIGYGPDSKILQMISARALTADIKALTMAFGWNLEKTGQQLLGDVRP